MTAGQKKDAEPKPSDKEYTYKEFLEHFAPDIDSEVEQNRDDSPSQIGRDIVREVLRELQENLAKHS